MLFTCKSIDNMLVTFVVLYSNVHICYTYKMKFKSRNLNLSLSLLGGQSFLWKKAEDEFIALHSNFVLRVFKDRNSLHAEQVYGEEIDIKKYFDESALQDFFKSKIFCGESFYQKARAKLGDMLVLEQPFEDTFFSFLLSSNNSILRIRRSAHCLSRKIGKRVAVGSEKHFLFPSAEILAELKEEDFLDCGAGYRASFLKESAKKFLHEKDELSSLRGLELIEKLKAFKGVGDKVADCIAIFSGKADEYSPIDRWAKRAILRHYGKEFKKYAEYRGFLSKKFGEHAKYAGQYLFESERLRS